MKRLGLVVLPLLLAACGGTGTPLSAQVGMTANLVGADITSNLTVKRDAATGQVTGLSIRQTSTQPTLRVAVAPSSLGVTINEIEVSVVDAAGITYSSVVKQSFAERVPSGYACRATPTDIKPDPSIPLTDQCDYPLKMPYARTVNVASLPVIDATITQQVADDFARRYTDPTSCPDLSLRVRLFGFDDLNRPIEPLVIPRAAVSETCNTVQE